MGPEHLFASGPHFTVRTFRLCAGKLFRLSNGVVLLAVDLAAGAVELMVKLSFVLAGKLAPVCGTIGAILLVNSCLLYTSRCV